MCRKRWRQRGVKYVQKWARKSGPTDGHTGRAKEREGRVSASGQHWPQLKLPCCCFAPLHPTPIQHTRYCYRVEHDTGSDKGGALANSGGCHLSGEQSCMGETVHLIKFHIYNLNRFFFCIRISQAEFLTFNVLKKKKKKQDRDSFSYQ